MSQDLSEGENNSISGLTPSLSGGGYQASIPHWPPSAQANG